MGGGGLVGASALTESPLDHLPRYLMLTPNVSLALRLTLGTQHPRDNAAATRLGSLTS